MRVPPLPDGCADRARQQHVGDDVADDQRCRQHQHEGGGDIDVADPHGTDDGRADGRQREDDRCLDLAGQHVGQDDALVHDQRMQRVRHGMAHDDGAFGKALGPCGLDILRVQRIEQIAAHDPHIVGEPAEGGDGDDRPDMLHEVDELVPRPGCAAVAGRVEAVDLGHLKWNTMM